MSIISVDLPPRVGTYEDVKEWNIRRQNHEWPSDKTYTEVHLVARERQLLEALRQLEEARFEIGLTKRLEMITLTCGHWSRYGFTDNGGKTGHCVTCRAEAAEAKLQEQAPRSGSK